MQHRTDMPNELQQWEELLEPIKKSAVPLEFIKHIVFYYPNGKEIVLDLASTHTFSPAELEKILETNYATSDRISMIVDAEKVRLFIEPITKSFLDDYFN